VRSIIIVALALVVHGCAARRGPAAAGQAPRADTVVQLQGALAAIFGDASVEHAQIGVRVTTLAGDELFALGAKRFLIPASNQKMLTAAAAAERLGWDFRYTTRLLATGPLDNGVLHGDLVVWSDGDPTINPRHGARWNAFDDWAAQLAARGLKSVVGHLVGDDNAFAEPGWGVGWAWDNLQYGYGAQVSSLQYNENAIDVVVGPGRRAGAAAIIGTSPVGSGVIIANHVVTAAPGSETRLEIARVPGSARLDVHGQIAADATAVTINASVDNPTRLYVNALRDALSRHGISISDTVADIDELRAPPTMAAAVELLVDRSPPLLEIVDVAMKWSRNGYAETMLLSMTPPGEPATGARGLDAMRETLASLGLGREGYLPRDGSGLTRYDYVSADTLTRLLQRLAADPKHAERYASTLPVAGVSGTLANRMKGTVAEGRVLAKTGSLSNVRALSGYLTTLAGERLVFSILVNNYQVPTAQIDALVDKALVRLVEFRR
jgi:serine-type D-Ala-D-Ala carboxypeptidase/endopeptidase (penicillin-binding protein 4)